MEGSVNHKGQTHIHFLTATNTLGSSFWLEGEDDELSPSLPVSNEYTGFGGLAGAALHPLALGEQVNEVILMAQRELTIIVGQFGLSGNVRRHRTLLDASHYGAIRAIRIIGAGGVDSQLAAQRMLAAGADLVGVATALGQRGPQIFADISA